MLEAQLATQLFATPMAMKPLALGTLLTTLSQPRVGTPQSAFTPAPLALAARKGRSGRLPGGAYMEADGIAVLPILGTLMRRPTELSEIFGFPTYQSITDSIVALSIEDSVRGILLDIDSPGGDANGCTDAADFIRQCIKQTGVPIWAIANETACSAAYALAAATNQIWVPRTADVGSIGVVCAHIDQSSRDAKSGFKWTYIYAGANKTALNPHEPLTAEALKGAQRDVDTFFRLFVNQVAVHRKLSPDTVRGTKANTYMGADAVKAGLADRVGTFNACLTAFIESLNQ